MYFNKKRNKHEAKRRKWELRKRVDEFYSGIESEEILGGRWWH